MKFFITVLVVLVLGIGWADAQSDPDTTKPVLKHFITSTDMLKDKVLKFVFTLDARQSIVRNRFVGIDGIKVGLEYNYKWRFGVGVYGLLSPLNIYYIDPVTKHDTLKLVMHFIYGSLFTEYVLFKNKRWEVSTPMQYGVGRTIAHRKTFHDELLKSKVEYSHLVEASINGHYKVFNWIGLGGGGGYRYMLNKKSTIRSSFNSPIYIIKVKLFLGEIYKNLKKKR